MVFVTSSPSPVTLLLQSVTPPNSPLVTNQGPKFQVPETYRGISHLKSPLYVLLVPLSDDRETIRTSQQGICNTANIHLKEEEEWTVVGGSGSEIRSPRLSSQLK